MKRASRSLTLAFITLAAILYWVHHSQDSRVRLQDLARSAEAGSVAAESHFSPAEDLERIDYTRLQQAQHTIDIAMYAFTDRYLAEQLREIAGRGVRIRIYRDQSEYEREQEREAKNRKSESTTSILSGVPNVEIRVKGKRELMHLKAYLIDGTILRDGSANWSPSGLKRQDNNAHFTADPAQVEAFRRTFEQMWSRPENLVIQ